jgi:hypothetical protein
MSTSLRRRAAVAGASLLLGTLAFVGPTYAGTANTSGPYDPSGVGLPSGNGNGNNNGNRPCAGCVGKADAKNPQGQLPGPLDDGNNGYECDTNSGIGRTNPAHSGCGELQEG